MCMAIIYLFGQFLLKRLCLKKKSLVSPIKNISGQQKDPLILRLKKYGSDQEIILLSDDLLKICFSEGDDVKRLFWIDAGMPIKKMGEIVDEIAKERDGPLPKGHLLSDEFRKWLANILLQEAMDRADQYHRADK